MSFFGAFFGLTPTIEAEAPEPEPVPIPVPVTHGEPEYHDIVALALDRLPEQFRPRGP